nr:hypothetical protein [[Ruminococcus] lactaris]
MNYKELLFDTLEKLGTSKTNLGYDYIVYGLLLMEEDPHCISCITKFYTLILRITTAQHGNVSRRIYEIVFSLYGSLPTTVCSKKSSAEAVLTTDLQIKNFLSILMNILIQ